MMAEKITRIESPQQLTAWREPLQTGPARGVEGVLKILLCTGGGCIASGALALKQALHDAIGQANLVDKVQLVPTGCLGPCVKGPVLLIEPGKVFYQNVKPTDAAEIIEKHILGGEVVQRLTWPGPDDDGELKPTPAQRDITFFNRQQKVVLRNCGLIDPGCIAEFIARDGYRALGKVLSGLTSEDVLAQLKASGLRGRGGAGFPIWQKWSYAHQAPGEKKYVLCNADEGDPGAFMDRSVLEGDPHSVIEGLVIAAYTVGASEGFVYVRAEYPLAVERLEAAIDQARLAGLLGENILGCGFSFDLEIRMGSGAFVCGEETALIASIESLRGEPRPRPPFPALEGLWGKPTVLNNVESYANVPAILLSGGERFAETGTEKSPGTKVFALAGDINIAGLVEVPIGTSLRELIFDIGGGIPGGKKFKAAQIGGPSGGCIPAEHLDVPLDYESLNDLDAIMGSGGLVVMDENTCMVDVARFFMEFVQEESCGKCVPCRLGTKRMLEVLQRICAGQGQAGDLEHLEELAHGVQASSLCGLGQTAPNPLLSTLRFFRDEYEAHINERRCPAGVCKGLVNYQIDSDKCIGCTVCATKCPTDAITGQVKNAHEISQEKCISCGLCHTICKFDAVVKE